MNINSNYSARLIQQNNSISLKNKTPQDSNPSDVNFKGLPNCLKPYLKRPVVFDAELNDYVHHVSNVLRIPTNTVEDNLAGKTNAHLRFLNTMINKFNGHNFSKEAAEKEDSSIVLNLLNRIKEPKEEHIGFVNRSRLTMTDVYKCFNKCNDDPQKLSALEDMYLKLNKTHFQESYMKQIIDSPNTEEYVKNIDVYLPHFSASVKPDGLIAKIDKELAEKSTDFEKLYDNAYIEKILDSYPETSVFNKDSLVSNYTKEGAKLLYISSPKFEATSQTMNAGDAKGFMRIYRTTNEENFDFRKSFIGSNYFNFGERERMGKNEVNDLAVVLDFADKDPHAQKFLAGLNSHNTGLRSASGYIKLFDEIGAKRLSQDVNAIVNIIKNDYYNPTQSVLDYYNVVASKPKNIFTVIMDKMGVKAPITKSEVSIRELMGAENMDATIERKAKPIQLGSVLNAPMVKSIDEIPVVEKTEKSRRSFFKPYVPKAPNAKKLIIINDVDSKIKNKLGPRVYGEQKAIYADNATKMRAGMLDEIFASIKDTRAQERANGTFSKHKSISNEAAVDLYRRINGKNKKLVNYMLKKTNADGTRTFSVNDILDTLADANRSILEGQKASTKLNRFTSKDERAIYDSILANKTEEFGSLQRKSAKKA